MEFNNLKTEDYKKIIEYYEKQYADELKDMERGKDYYENKQEIDKKIRLMLDDNGELQELHNLPNSKIKDNQYAKLVDQKVNYLLSNIPVIKSEDKNYQEILKGVFDTRWLRTQNKVITDLYNGPIGWMFVGMEDDKIYYEKQDPTEIIPIWKDNNHEKLQAVIRKRVISAYEEGEFKNKTTIEFYTDEKVLYFERNGDTGELKEINKKAYLKKGENEFRLGKIPFVYFKSPEEKSLLNRVKSLQDALNLMLSNFTDNMLEDARNSILVIQNYSGEDPEAIKAMIAQYGVIQVETVEGVPGGVDTIQIEVNAENYKLIIELLKKAIIENGRGFDAKNDKTSQAPNEINIKSMYSDIELDANKLELELKASLDYMQELIIALLGLDVKEFATFTFKRNMMVNDESLVRMIKDSEGTISTETKVEKNPLVDDPVEELKRLKRENEQYEEDNDDYRGTFNKAGVVDGEE